MADSAVADSADSAVPSRVDSAVSQVQDVLANAKKDGVNLDPCGEPHQEHLTAGATPKCNYTGI